MSSGQWAGVGGTQAQDVNNSGDIVGWYGASDGTHGFLYSGGTYTALTHSAAGTVNTFAEGINNQGQIVGYYQDADLHYHGFVYNEGSYINFDVSAVTPANETDYGGTFLTGITDSGEIVGYFYNSQGAGAFEISLNDILPDVAPVVTVPTVPLSTFSKQGFFDNQFSLTGLSVNDIDAGNAPITVTLAAAHGTLVVRNDVVDGLTAADIAGNGSGYVKLTGSQAAIDATLAATSSVMYRVFRTSSASTP